MPDTLATSKTLPEASQTLTLPVAPLEDPVTISLNSKSPTESDPGASTVIVGVITYPCPEFVMNISSSFPADVNVDIPVAVAIPKVSWKSM